MSLLKRYRSAFIRHHRSAGFGVHSPSAYRFITEVLRERLPYYAYDELRSLRQSLPAEGKPHHAISNKECQMLFRIANHFGPRHILLVGWEGVLPAMSVLMPCSLSNIYMCGSCPNDALLTLPDGIAHRVHTYPSFTTALSGYMSAVTRQPEPYFALISHAPEDADESMAARRVLCDWLDNDCVIVMRNLHRDKELRMMWENAKQTMPWGHSYTNDKTGILVANRKLQREDFYLWL